MRKDPICIKCGELATQAHGVTGHFIYTCDKHADEVMMEMMRDWRPKNE